MSRDVRQWKTNTVSVKNEKLDYIPNLRVSQLKQLKTVEQAL